MRLLDYQLFQTTLTTRSVSIPMGAKTAIFTVDTVAAVILTAQELNDKGAWVNIGRGYGQFKAPVGAEATRVRLIIDPAGAISTGADVIFA